MPGSLGIKLAVTSDGQGNGVPGAPMGVTASPGPTRITVSWSAVSGATSYNLYRGTTPGGEGGSPYQSGLSSPTYSDTGLTNGTRYYYFVTAVNAAGEGSHSAEVNAIVGSGLLLPRIISYPLYPIYRE